MKLASRSLLDVLQWQVKLPCGGSSQKYKLKLLRWKVSEI